MKKFLCLSLVVLTPLFFGCVSEGTDTVVLPEKITAASAGNVPPSVIPNAVRDAFESSMPVYSGVTPPEIGNRQYVIDNLTLVNGNINNEVLSSFLRNNGMSLDELYFAFEKGQDGKLSYTQKGTGQSEDIKVRVDVVGKSNDFSAYFERIIVSDDGIRIKLAVIISGTLTDDGISNLHYAFIVLENNNPQYTDWLPPVNSYVIFKDRDGLTNNSDWFVPPTVPITPPVGGEPLNYGEQTYRTVVINGKKWMAENLNYTPKGGNSWCYGNKPDSCVKYGRLYDWAAATTVCPTEWHLPSRQEWSNLAVFAGGTGTGGDGGTAGNKLKSARGWNNNGNGTDAYGFSALPGGNRSSGGSFSGAGSNSIWWTATEYGNGDGDAYDRNMNYYHSSVKENHDSKTNGFSVRCVEN